MPIQNKLILYLALVLLLVCAPSIPVYATQNITQDDLNESGVATRNINVVGEDDGWYSVKVPLMTSVSVTNSRYPVSSKVLGFSCVGSGELPVDKKLIVYPEDTVTLYREGSDDTVECGVSGMPQRDCIALKSYVLSDTARSLVSGKVILKELPAGHWYGYITITVEVIDHGITLTSADVLNYVQSDTTVTELTIPKYIDVDGQQILVNSIKTNALANYPNLTKVTLESGRKYFSFIDTIDSSMNPLTIDCGNANVSFETTAFQNVVTLENIGKSYACLFYHADTNVYLNDLTKFDYYAASYTETWNLEEMTIPADIRTTGYEVQPLNRYRGALTKKLIVPQLKYVDGVYVSSLCNTLEEVYYDNEYVITGAFQGCTSLKKVTFGPHVKVIMENAFNGCSNLTDVTFEGQTKYIGTTAFYDSAYYNNLKSTQSVVYINNHFVGYGDDYVQDDDTYIVESFTQSENFSDMLNLSLIPGNVRKIKFAENLYGGTVTLMSKHTMVDTLDLTGMACDVASILYRVKTCLPNIKTIIAGESFAKTYNSVADNNIEIKLSNTTKYISDFAYNHYTAYSGETFTIPSSVQSIGNSPTNNTVLGGNGMTNHVFYDFGKDNQFREFIVEETPEGGTTYYKAVDGILYTGDMKALVAVPRAKTFDDNKFVLPDGVVNLGELSFSRNTNFSELVLDDDLIIHQDIQELKVSSNAYNYDGYFPLNSGNSLSVAVYGYTNIQAYTVNDSNPNYKSVNGIIYSKDGEHLIAIPHGYQGTLEIVEGCKYWDKNAMWIYGGNLSGINTGITGITIPSTMEYIDPDQLNYINSKLSSVNYVINSEYFRKYSFLYSPKLMYTPHYNTEVGDTIDVIADAAVAEHSYYWIDSNINSIGGMGYTNVYTVSFAPIELSEGKYKVHLSIRNQDASEWYIFSRRTNQVGGVDVNVDITGRDLTYYNGDVITVTDPDVLMHISLACADESKQTGALPDGIEFTLERVG